VLKKVHHRQAAEDTSAVPAFVDAREGRLVADLVGLLGAVGSEECHLTRQGEPSRQDTRRLAHRLDDSETGSVYTEFLLFLAIQLDLVERVDGRLALRPASSAIAKDRHAALSSCFEVWCRSPFWSERYPRRRIAWCSDQMAFAFYREPMPRYREIALGALRGLPLETWTPFDRVLGVAKNLGFHDDVRWGCREAFGSWDETADGPHTLLSRFAQEALFWLGVVRVGREAPSSPRFSIYITPEGARLMGHPRAPKALGAAVPPEEHSRSAG